MNHDRTGNPEIDALLDVADREHAEGWRLDAVYTAESTVADARLADIAARQDAAYRRWEDARELLTAAENAGDAAAITTARAHEAVAYREFDAISDSMITEGLGIIAARNESMGQRLDQMNRTDTAEVAVLDALREFRS